MADAITIKALQDASLDAKSLEEVVNGNEVKQVTTRKGETYPSVKKAVKTMFDNGGLPATPFATKALMTASSLANDKYAMVTDDTVNNGLYLKTAGVWAKSAYDPLEQRKQYVDVNPLFKPKRLIADDNIDDLESGYFIITSDSVAATIGGVPWPTSRQGYIYSLRDYIAHHQIAVPRNLDINRIRQRFGNGKLVTDPLFSWLPWQDVVAMQDLDSIRLELSKKPSLNLFPNLKLTESKSTAYQATHLIENNFDVLSMNTGAITIVYYDIPVDNENFKVGDVISLSVEAFTDVSATSSTNANSADISLLCLNASGGNIAPNATVSSIKINEWNELQISREIPALCKTLRIRFTHRNFGSVSKFRKAVLSSNAFSAQFITASQSAATPVLGANLLYVAKTGNASNVGTYDKPLLTIQSAIDLLPNGGEIKVLDSEPYRESLTINSRGHVKISSAKDGRVNLFGSNKLEVTKTSGLTKVYQAPLAAKPTGMGGNRGKPLIVEWGTPSKLIDESERHYLHHGKTHRLPYTEMFEAASKAELDTPEGNGKWFWETGVIYFAATDGGNATVKRYEARVRSVLEHTNGTIELIRVNSWFSNDVGMKFGGLKTTRSSCQAFGAFSNGFSDNANVTISYRDESGGNGNDGFNSAVGNYSAEYSDINTRLEQVYFDPYGHDSGDDGLSCHYRSDATIYGGLFEYNTKADVVHVTGANCVCFNTEARGTTNGFYSATAPTGDAERVKTIFKCVGTKASDNEYSYRAGDDSVLFCENTTAINPTSFGYYQNGAGSLNTLNAKFIGESLKQKSGNVVVQNTELLTP